MNKTRIIIVEDEPAILRSIKATINRFPDKYQVAATAYNGQEALEAVKNHHPQIVITDIKMPLVDGLELIEEVKNFDSNIKFIILSGYADFEYARTALTLGVDNYLLKPLDYDKIEPILNKITHNLQSEFRTKTEMYILDHVKKKIVKNNRENPLGKYDLYLIFSYLGCINDNIYYQYNETDKIISNLNLKFLSVIEACHNITIIPFRGNYYNELIYAVLFKKDTYVPIIEIAKTIQNHIQVPDIFINYIISEKNKEGSKLAQTIQDCYFITAYNLPFAQNEIIRYCKKESNETVITVLPESKQCIDQLNPYSKNSNITEQIDFLIDIWENKKVSQFQIQTDLDYLIVNALKMSAGYEQHPPTAIDIITTANSFPTLKETILLELENIYYKKIDIAPSNDKQDLAKKVKDYIDTNFTQVITYKTFYEIFGYNEKYITLLFKERYHISPSKYIVKLRIGSAKKILEQNPSILLKEVAKSVGYSDALYFSRVFKNWEGISPSAYIKSLSR